MNWKMRPNVKYKLLRTEAVVVLCAAAILSYILIVSPSIGLADSGDFSRIMNTVGLRHLSSDYHDRYFGYFNRLYEVKSIFGFPSMVYASSQLLIVKAAMLFDFLVSWDRTFDVRTLGIIYSALYLLAFYILIKYNKPKTFTARLLLAVLTLIIFTDVGYASFFNSLYGESVSLVFLLLTIGFAVYMIKQATPSRKQLRIFLACAMIFVGAKVQNSPIGLLIALFCLRLVPLNKDKDWRRSVITSAITLGIFSTCLYAFSVPSDIRVCNKYQTVFFGVLRNSPTPEKDLQELGLNQELAVLSGTNFFMQDLPINIKNPIFLREIYRKVDHKKVALFYIKHPARFLEKLKIAAENGFTIRPGYLGNYEKTAGASPQSKTNTFALWSSFKSTKLPKNFVFVAFVFITYFLGTGIRYLKAKDLQEKLRLEIFTLIGLIGLTQFIIPIIGDGEADLSKHLFLFNVCFDAILITCSIWIIDTVFCRLKDVKKL